MSGIHSNVAKDLVQQSPRWDDFIVPASSLRLGGSKPPLDTAYKGGYVLSFIDGSDKAIYFNVQMPHSWLLGSEIRPHFHYVMDVNGAGGGAENVKFDFTYSWANIDSESFPSETTISSTVDVQSINAHVHKIFGLPYITVPNKSLSSILICSLTRDTTVANNSSNNVYFMSFDIHIRYDTLGSSQEFIK